MIPRSISINDNMVRTDLSDGSVQLFPRLKLVDALDVSSTDVRPVNRDVEHPFSYTKVREVYPNGELVEAMEWPTGVHRYWRYSGAVWGFGPSDSIWRISEGDFNTANTRALQKFYNELKNSEINLSTTIGEGRETLQLLHSLGTSIKRFKDEVARREALRPKGGRLPRKLALLRTITGRLKRGGKAVVEDASAVVADLVLSVNLVLKPLVADVEALRKHAVSGKSDVLDYRVLGRSTVVVNQTAERFPLPGFIETEYMSDSMRSEYAATCRLSDLHAFENWRAGLTVRPSMAWELTTLSFLADYFVNIGQWLELWEASVFNNGVILRHGHHTETRRLVRTKDLDGTGSLELGVQGWLSAKCSSTYELKSLNRAVLTALPVPGTPIVKLPTHGAQLLNIGALLSNLSRK